MKCKLIVGFIFFCLFSIPILGYSQSTEDLKKGVVKIKTFNNGREVEKGTGIVVGESSGFIFILTANHVLIGADSITANFYQMKWQDFVGMRYNQFDEDLDIGVLKVRVASSPDLPDSLPQLTYPEETGLTESARIFSIGHPLEEQWLVSNNEILTTAYSQEVRKFTISNSGLAKGSSGGPIFDADSNLIGLITDKNPVGAIGVKIGTCREILNLWGIPNNLLKEAQSKQIDMSGSTPDQYCTIAVTSNPSGAEVWLFDDFIGYTPAQISLSSDEVMALDLDVLAVRLDGYEDFIEPLDCSSSSVHANLTAIQISAGIVYLGYMGDLMGCELQLTFSLGGVTAYANSNPFPMQNVQLGTTAFEITGTINCGYAGVCQAYGSGYVDLVNGQTYYVMWETVASGGCKVWLQTM